MALDLLESSPALRSSAPTFASPDRRIAMPPHRRRSDQGPSAGDGASPRPDQEPSSPPRVAVCIPTCRRPGSLANTLRTLSAQQLRKHPDLSVRVCVSDNDPRGSAEETVTAARNTLPWPIAYEVEPRVGISHNRNRLVRMSNDADFIAFIDDDQEAEPQWLDELVDAQQQTGGDAIIGGLGMAFEVAPPRHLVFAYRRPEPREDLMRVPAKIFRTGNLLLRRSLLSEDPFDPSFGLTGGEDQFLARQLHRQGARFHWAGAARVHEVYPSSRVNLGWLLRRMYRTGAVGAAIDRRLNPWSGWLKRLLLSFGHIGAGTLLLAAVPFRGPASAVQASCRFSKGVGGMAGLVGATYQEYRNIHGS